MFPFLSVFLKSINNKMNNVVVLIPPAIDAGEPPTNIKNPDKTCDTGFSAAWSIVVNPAVLVVMLWKNALTILSPVLKPPSVFGLFHSKIINKPAPTKIKMPVTHNTTLV